MGIGNNVISWFRDDNALFLRTDNDVLSFVMGDGISYFLTGDNALSVLVGDNVSLFSAVTRQWRIDFKPEELEERYSSYLYRSTSTTRVLTTDLTGFLSHCTTAFSIVNRDAPTVVANSYTPKIWGFPLIAIVI